MSAPFVSITNPRVTAFGAEHATLLSLVEAQHLLRGEHARHWPLKSFYATVLSPQGACTVIDHVRVDNVWVMGDPTVLFP